ncbi:Auxin Efflux Carrier [Caldicellulosiruptor hydrothermalis 108]|uniref:Auxin Efflux Carrier n=1 Tax=Caldicellulosiruptor hydrothermalis (strain DSM 18901 / VKM B-2411 / 108) TaxID=632292 RepID=E4QA50_CALH1|nr:AEC family transporter [Caldicellulosiruptor hydrothermalis]ADQ07022.1 Auxin Efflux Carrier [Caldicellulosiruptor hydrothermalis 108]
MNDEVLILLKNLLFLFAIIFIGFMGTKLNLFSNTVKDSVSELIVKVTAPILLFTTISSKPYSSQVVKNVFILILSAFVGIMILLLLGYITGSLFKLQGKTFYTHIFCSAFGNTGFLSFPLLYSIFGEKGVFFAASYNIMHDFLAWSLGLSIISRHNREKTKFGFVNANSIAVFVAFIIYLIKGILPYDIKSSYDKVFLTIYDALNPFGKTTIYLSMFFIGCLLAEVSFKETLKTSSAYAITLFKMVLLPLGIMYLTKYLSIDNFTRLIIVLQTGMPTAITSSVLSYRYDGDSHYATRTIFITTIFSLITIPLLVFLYYHI